MPSLGPLEILVVGVLALIVFGPDRLPDIARTVGRTLNELRRMAADVRTEFQDGMNLDEVLDETDTVPEPRAEPGAEPGAEPEAEPEAEPKGKPGAAFPPEDEA